ncbi:hypothetical protein HID58_061363 [Brassica napus]|uniref:Serine hydroxymethyltransferase-like domain-containing protein n=1 Tax=Brassica napus TaxID=3708 RepID=A0ABQ7ZYD4_BRANA|nr:hypothetical protein HID58_061363 [Brassica napus]
MHEFIHASNDAPTILSQILVAKKQYQLCCFPWLQGGPENIQITAFAIALKQVAIPENKACIQQMKKTQVLALALLRRKCRLVTGVVVGSHSFGLNWNRVEAFALQYEMHASSYQRDIATAQQVSKTSGAPAIGCLTVLPAAITTRPMVWHYDSDCGFNYSYATKSSVPRMVGNMVYGGSPVSAALSVGRREFYALFIEEGLDWSSIPWKKEAMKSFEKVIKLAEKRRVVCILNSHYSTPYIFGFYAMHVYE